MSDFSGRPLLSIPHGSWLGPSRTPRLCCGPLSRGPYESLGTAAKVDRIYPSFPELPTMCYQVEASHHQLNRCFSDQFDWWVERLNLNHMGELHDSQLDLDLRAFWCVHNVQRVMTRIELTWKQQP